MPKKPPNYDKYDDIDDTLDRYAKEGWQWLRNHPGSFLIIVIVFLAVPFVFSMVYRVGRQEEAIVLRFGHFARQQGPGLQYKLPYPIEEKYIVNTRKVQSEQFGYKPGKASYKEKQFDREATMLTGDLGVARVEWEVQYRKVRPLQFLFNVRHEQKLIRETTLDVMRRIVGDKDVTKVITVARKDIRQKVKKNLQNVLDTLHAGIRIDAIELQASEPPDPVYPAFKEVDSARQDRERMVNEAKRQEEKIINEAQGTASQRISESQGEARAVINTAKGEARRFNKMVKQYETAPKITKTRMFLETMQSVITDSEQVYVVDQKLKGLLPHLQLQKNQ